MLLIYGILLLYNIQHTIQHTTTTIHHTTIHYYTLQYLQLSHSLEHDTNHEIISLNRVYQAWHQILMILYMLKTQQID